MYPIKVLVIGSGLGGLCLAQSLRQQPGVQLAIFERDKSPWERPQGYRLHIDSDGVVALHRALPAALYALFDATSMKAVDATTIVDTNLQVLKRLPSDAHGGSNPHALAHGLPARSKTTCNG